MCPIDLWQSAPFSILHNDLYPQCIPVESVREILCIFNKVVNLENTSDSDPHFFADPDPGKSLHADPDPRLKGRNDFFFSFFHVSDYS